LFAHQTLIRILGAEVLATPFDFIGAEELLRHRCPALSDRIARVKMKDRVDDRLREHLFKERNHCYKSEFDSVRVLSVWRDSRP
jgi:hypothetical protein